MNPARLKKHLVQSGKVSRQEILKAEDYAMTAGISLEEALLFLEILTPEDLGATLSGVYDLPYRPLLKRELPERIKKFIPAEVAEKWGVFPVDFDEREDLLTLAISDPEDTGRMLTLEANLLAPHRVVYTVASEAEIKAALEKFYKGKAPNMSEDLEIPEDFMIIPEEFQEKPTSSPEIEKSRPQRILLLDPELKRARAIRTLLELEGMKAVTWAASIKEIAALSKKGAFDSLLVNGNIFSRDGGWLKEINGEGTVPEIFYYSNFSSLLFGQAYPYRQVGDALISLASFFVGWLLRDQPRRLSQIRLCARYGRLLAMRLGLPEAKMDAIVLAAWLSVPELQHSIFESVQTPYSLREIINFGTALKKGGRKIETTVFGIVRVYLNALQRDPEIDHNLSRVREILVKKFSFPEDGPVIETFLRLIKEDRFLKDVGKLSGRVLIVDPEVSGDSAITLRLMNEGYQVEVVPSVEGAGRFLAKNQADVVISEVDLPEGSAIDFCRHLKTSPEQGEIFFTFLTADETPGLAARCLEAGADDFLPKPVDLELLALKISRHLIRKGMGRTQRGVSGSLREMQFTDIVQILSAGEKNVVIHLEKETQKGKVYIRRGEVIHAVTGPLTGEAAFYALMGWSDATFQVTPCDTFPERTIEASLMSLLMEGARLMDEASADEVQRGKTRGKNEAQGRHALGAENLQD